MKPRAIAQYAKHRECRKQGSLQESEYISIKLVIRKITQKVIIAIPSTKQSCAYLLLPHGARPPVYSCTFWVSAIARTPGMARTSAITAMLSGLCHCNYLRPACHQEMVRERWLTRASLLRLRFHSLSHQAKDVEPGASLSTVGHRFQA